MPYLSRQRHLVKVREFRSHLKEILEGSEPRIIGTDFHARAFLIPLKANGHMYGQPMRDAIAKARKDFAELVQIIEGL